MFINMDTYLYILFYNEYLSSNIIVFILDFIFIYFLFLYIFIYI